MSEGTGDRKKRTGTQGVPSLPTYDSALSQALQALGTSQPGDARPTDTVALQDALGRVLADPVRADRDLPPFNRAQMDGYALRAAAFRAQSACPVVATIAAGQSVEDIRVPPGSCVAIATGAPLPADVDTVIQHEWSDRGDSEGNPVTFTVDSIAPCHAVHPRGADAKKGDVVLEAGMPLEPHHLGIAAMVGQASLCVAQQPRIVLLTSGDEVLPLEAMVEPHQIRNSNAPMLIALLERLGGRVERHEHLPDERDATIHAVGRAVQDADLIVTVGGVSAGDRDHFPDAFDAHSVKMHVRGAAIQPGRPIAIGRGANGAMVAALPGNPVSALACCTLFIWPIVRVMLGTSAGLPWREMELARDVQPNAKRQAFRPAIVSDHNRIEVPDWSGSGDLVHTAPTTGLVQLPLQSDPVPAGRCLPFLPWPCRTEAPQSFHRDCS